MPGSVSEPFGPGLFRIAREADCERGGVFGNTRQHRDAAASRLLFQLADDFEFFLILERSILTDSAKRYHTVDPCLDHRVEVFGGGGKIEGLIVPELSGDRGKNAVPVDPHKEFIIYNLI